MDLNQLSDRVRSSYHTKIRGEENTDYFNRKRKDFKNSMNKLAISGAINDLKQDNIQSLIESLKDHRRSNITLNANQITNIVSYIQAQQQIPFNFLINLFAKLDQPSQKSLLLAGVANVAIFLPFQQIIKSCEILNLYLMLISKLAKPSRHFKQYFFSQKIIQTIFSNKLQSNCQLSMLSALKAITKYEKISQDQQIYKDYIQSLVHILDYIEVTNQGLSSLCSAFINVLKTKDMNIIDIFVNKDLIGKCLTRIKGQTTIEQKSSLNSLVCTFYTNYVENKRLTPIQFEYLLNMFQPYLQLGLSLVQQISVSNTTKSDIYFVLDYLMGINKFTQIICSNKMFTWICQRVLQNYVNETQLQNILRLLIKYLRRVIIENIVKYILDYNLMPELLNIMISQRWTLNLKINILIIFSELLTEGILVINFKRIPNHNILIEEGKCTDELWLRKVEEIQKLLEYEEQSQRNC